MGKKLIRFNASVIIATVVFFLLTCCVSACIMGYFNTRNCEHKFNDWQTSKAETCITLREEKRTCSICGFEETRQTDIKGTHLYEKSSKKATATEDGYVGKKCKYCKKIVKEKTISKIKSVTVNKTMVFNGKAQIPTVTVKDEKNKPINQKYYSVSVANNVNIGKATVTVKFNSPYDLTVKRYFYVVPKGTKISGAVLGKNYVKLYWKKQTSHTDGYQIICSGYSNFQKDKTRFVDVNDPNTSVNVLKNLRENTNYYFSIRTFKKVGSTKIYSAWSPKQKYKTDVTTAHDISGSVPKCSKVSGSFFDDAVFVGDSISLGLSYYESANNVLGKAQFLTAGSLSATNALWDVSSKSVHPRYQGKKMKVEDAISLTKAKKIYIMLGMNDLAGGPEKSINNLNKLTKNILKKSPNVKLYFQSVTPKMNMGSKKTGGLTNEKITKYNKLLAKFCSENGYYFINVASVMYDKDGYLIKSYCGDPNGMGIHFAGPGFKAWTEYLLTHVPMETEK